MRYAALPVFLLLAGTAYGQAVTTPIQHKTGVPRHVAADVTPPDAPANLAATPGDNQVTLDWDDNSEPDLASYRVYRSLSSGTGYSVIQASVVPSTYVDATAVNGTTYYYVVTARDAAGNESDLSDEDSATPVDATPPAAPTMLVATGGDGQVFLNWADNTEPDLASYTVYRSLSSGSGYSSIQTGVVPSAYTDNAVVNSTTYYYVVTALDNLANESAVSNEDDATPSAGGGTEDYTVESVAEMRAQTCTLGETLELVATASAGLFTCTANASAWRTPYWDDGGVQYASGTAGRHWKRQMAYNRSDPIDMGWYTWMAENARVDTLYANLADDFSPDLYVRAPNIASVNNLIWTASRNTTGVLDTLIFLESAKVVNFYKSTSGTSRDHTNFIAQDTGNYVYIGGENLNLHFTGPASAASGNSGTSGQGTSRPDIVDAFSFYACGTAGTKDSVTVKVNIYHPSGAAYGTRDGGCSTKKDWGDIVVGGYWEAAAGFNNGVDHVHLDDVVLADPWMRRYNWNGGSPGTCSNGYKTGGTSRIQDPGASDMIATGELTVAYGMKLYFEQVQRIGNSADDPLIMHFLDGCRSGPNTGNPGVGLPWGCGTRGQSAKIDNLGPSAEGYYQIDDAPGEGLYANHCQYVWEIEADASDSDQHHVVTAVNSFSSSNASYPNHVYSSWNNNSSGGDTSDRHAIIGRAGKTNYGVYKVVDRDTVYCQGTVGVDQGAFQHLQIIRITRGGSGYGSGNVLRDCQVIGNITIASGSTGNTLENLEMSSGTITANNSFTCGGGGTVGTGTYSITNASHRTTLGVVDAGPPWTICPE